MPMRERMETDYAVGYRKPPANTRFKKGQSGNPSGRPRKTALDLDPGKILQLIDNEEIAVQIDGRRKLLLKGEIAVRQLFAMAIRGDLTTARLLAKMAAKHFGPEAEAPGETRFVIVPDKPSEGQS
jgi:hypothetical protein